MTPPAPPTPAAGGHLRPAVLALLVSSLLGLVGLVAARRAVDRQVDALLPRAFEQKTMGLALQRRLLTRDSLLFLYGSSELQRPVAFRAGDWFRSAPTGFRVVPVGKEGTLPLSHLQSLYALAPLLRGRAVVIEVSPGLFTRGDGRFTMEMYANNFSPLAAGMVAWTASPGDTLAQRLARRMLTFPSTLEGDPLLGFGLEALAGRQPADRALAALLRPLGRLQLAVIGVEDELRLWWAARAARRVPLEPAAAGPPDWAALEATAESLYQTQSTNNPFGFEDAYWLERREHLENKRMDAGRAEGILTVPAWEDLDLLLTLLKREGARPLVMDIPYMGRLLDFWGSTPADRAIYYERLAQAGARHGVPVVTFADHDMDRWFLHDEGGHQSPKGWVLTNRALDAFYHDRAD